MEAVKLLICREGRQVQAFPRFWLVALGLSLLLATATPTMLLAHYVASFALLSAPFFALGNPATAAGALTLPVTRRQIVAAAYLWVGFEVVGLTAAMSLWNLAARAVLPLPLPLLLPNPLGLGTAGAVQTCLAAAVLGVLAPLHLKLGQRGKLAEVFCYLAGFFGAIQLLRQLPREGVWALPPAACLGLYLAAALLWFGSYRLTARLYASWELS